MIDEAHGDDISVTVIGTGFDHRRRERAIRSSARAPRPATAARASTIASAAPLEIRDDDIDVPPFLR